MIETLARLKIPISQDSNPQGYGGGVYVLILTKPEAGYPEYWQGWTQGEMNERRLLIGSVYVDNAIYVEKDSLVDCQGDDGSYYWDNEDQKLYIHYEFDKTPWTTSLVISDTTGFSYIGHNVYIDDIKYLPLLQTLPTIKKKVDKFQQGKMVFQDQTIKLSNGDGQLDFLITAPIPGAEVTMVLYDTDDSSELEYYTGLISAPTETYDTISVKLIDKRRRENIKIPRTRFTEALYPDIESKYVDKIIPEAYHTHNRIKAYPLNGTVSSVNIQFRYLTDATVLSSVEVKEDDVWSTVTALNSNPSTGYFELSYADATNDNGGLLDCVCTVTGRAYSQPGDIIADMNDRYLSVPYDASEYDQTEWAAEDAKLEPVSLYMNKEQEIFKYIQEIQNGTNLWFVYYIQGDGKRSLRVNENTRASAGNIPFVKIKDDQKKVERDFSEYSSTVAVLYDKDWETGEYKRVEDDTYQTAALNTYRVDQDSEFQSLLPSLTDATAKAAWIAEDQSEARPSLTVILDVKNLDDLAYKLYDILTVDTTRPAETEGELLNVFYMDPDGTEFFEGPGDNTTIFYLDPDGDEFFESPDGTVIFYLSPGDKPDVYYEKPQEVKIITPERTYWGEFTGKVLEIGINATDYTLKLREVPA